MPAGNEQAYRGWTEADIARVVAERGSDPARGGIDVNAAIRGAGLNTNTSRINELVAGIRRSLPQQPQQDLQLIGQRARAIAGSPADTTDPRMRALIDLAGGRGEFASGPIGYTGTGMDLARSVPGLLEAAGGQFSLPGDIRQQAVTRLGPAAFMAGRAPVVNPAVLQAMLLRQQGR